MECLPIFESECSDIIVNPSCVPLPAFGITIIILMRYGRKYNHVIIGYAQVLGS